VGIERLHGTVVRVVVLFYWYLFVTRDAGLKSSPQCLERDYHKS